MIVSDAESAPVDYMGALKIVAVVVVGLLTVIGFGWEDIMGNKKISAPKKSETKKAASSEEDEPADYEKGYLDDEISEEALDSHTVGIS